MASLLREGSGRCGRPGGGRRDFSRLINASRNRTEIKLWTQMAAERQTKKMQILINRLSAES